MEEVGCRLGNRLDDEGVDVDVLRKSDGEGDARGHVIGDEGAVDAFIDLVGRGPVAVEAGQRELLGLHHAGTDLDDADVRAVELEAERVHARTFETRGQAALEILGYIGCSCSRVRIHSALGNLSPAESEARNMEGAVKMAA